jgi:hypothetical protein
VNQKIIIVDDFFPTVQVEKIHASVIGATFSEQKGPDAVYPNICTEHQPEKAADLLAAAHQRTRPVDLKLSCYRLGARGEKDDTFCHADGLYAKWAAVVYLTKLVRVGGTAFWMHVPTGLDQVPDDSLMNLAGFNHELWHKHLTAETNVKERWALAGFAGFKFNRLVTYPTSMFHSRVPNDITEPFGSSPSDGRLIWVAFYDL